jgi:hypothetical protein
LRLTVAESVKISVPLSVENKAKLNATDNRKRGLLFPLTPMFVIPGRRKAASPESMAQRNMRAAGFRARA